VQRVQTQKELVQNVQTIISSFYSITYVFLVIIRYMVIQAVKEIAKEKTAISFVMNLAARLAFIV
jgi:hypothetical protein